MKDLRARSEGSCVSNFYKSILDQSFEHYVGSEEREFTKLLKPTELKNMLGLKLERGPRTEEEIQEFVDQYLKHSMNTNHKKYMNQLWSKVELPSITGEFLATVTNTSMYTYEVAPVLTLMEHEMIQYLSHLVWGTSQTEGIMTSGGTASNLQAMMVARNTKFPEVKEKGHQGYGNLMPVVLCESNAHYSLKRAMNILGLGHESLIEIQSPTNGIVSQERISDEILNQKNLGRRPFLYIATAGTTVEGSYGDLSAIGKLCREHDMWFHVDGAYGGSVLLSSQYRNLMNGVEFCDSLSWDFHKILGMNLTCAFLLVKKKGVMKSSLTSGNDGYLFHDDDSLDLGPKSLQCGRRADIVKLWMNWLAVGHDGLEKRVDAMIESAKVFAELVKKDADLELMFEPQFVNVCFRVPGNIVEPIRVKLKERGLGMINYSQNEEGPFFRMVVSRPDLEARDHQEILSAIVKTYHEVKDDH